MLSSLHHSFCRGSTQRKLRRGSRHQQNDHWQVRRQSDETLRPRKRRKIISKKPKTARVHAPGSQDSLPSPSALQADVLEKNFLRENPKALPRSVLNFYLKLLEKKTSEEPSSFSSSGSDEPILDCSYGPHQDVDDRNTLESQKKHQTKMTNFVDVIFPKPVFSCLSSSYSYNVSIRSYCRLLRLLPPSKWNQDRHSISYRSPFLERLHVLAGNHSHLYL